MTEILRISKLFFLSFDQVSPKMIQQNKTKRHFPVITLSNCANSLFSCFSFMDVIKFLWLQKLLIWDPKYGSRWVLSNLVFILPNCQGGSWANEDTILKIDISLIMIISQHQKYPETINLNYNNKIFLLKQIRYFWNFQLFICGWKTS